LNVRLCTTLDERSAVDRGCAMAVSVKRPYRGSRDVFSATLRQITARIEATYGSDSFDLAGDAFLRRLLRCAIARSLLLTNFFVGVG
jgi:hypothetical protein